MREGSQAPCGGGAGGSPPPLPSIRALGGPHRSKKEARRRRSRTLCRVPALTWQFMSCALVMYTLVPGVGSRRVAGGPRLPRSPLGQALAWARPRRSLTTRPSMASSAIRKGQLVVPLSTGHLQHAEPCLRMCGFCPHNHLGIKKNRQWKLTPRHPDAKILNRSVSQPSNHPMKPLISPCGQRCQPTLIPASGVETWRPLSGTYQCQGGGWGGVSCPRTQPVGGSRGGVGPQVPGS